MALPPPEKSRVPSRPKAAATSRASAPAAAPVKLAQVPKDRQARLAAARAKVAPRDLTAHSTDLAVREALEDVAYAVEGVYELANVLEMTVDDARRIARHGIYLAQQNQEALAFDCARVAAAIAPEDVMVCVLAGAMFARMKMHAQALPFYLRLQKIDPKRVRTWVDSAEVRISLGQYSDAAADLGKALDLDPGTTTPAGRRASALIAKTLMAVGKK